MLPGIDFRAIRLWRNSRNSGFEELCCQLASLEPPVPGSQFYRKEGAGGDAGLECLWTLPDGRIHGLQSKYFPDKLAEEEWKQIDSSVSTALEKYPTLTRYTVCLPRDLSDRRVQRARKGGGLINEVSQRDQWGSRVQKWTGWAAAKGLVVEFAFWGSAEIGERLTRDDPRYSGRTLYWFGARLLTSEWFTQRFTAARDNLNRRYTPEANVVLPVADVLDGLARTPNLSAKFSRLRRGVRQAGEQYDQELRSLATDAAFTFDFGPFREALSRLDALLGAAPGRPDEPIPLAEIQAAIEASDALARGAMEWTPSTEAETGSRSRRRTDDRQFYYGRFSQSLARVASFLGSHELAAANVGAVLIEGEAGVGKSHLMADATQSRLANGWPTLLLLGQHLTAGNPWEAFLSELDLKAYSVEEFLGALDAAGQAAGVRSLILVDAINEGGGRRVWRERLPGFLTAISPFPHVAVALTCRTTYVDGIVPDALPAERLVRVTHHGFEGHESRAADIYLDRYGIARPNSPLLAPEFSNPLFLKTCCEALYRQGKRSFPKGVRGVKSVFDLYVAALETVLRERVDVDPRDRVARKALQRIAEEMAGTGYGVVERDLAKRLLAELHPATGYEKSLLHHLIAEGALAEDLEYSDVPGAEPRDVIRFTFERFSDHFIAEHLLDGNVVDGDVGAALTPDAPLGATLRGPDRWRLQGVMEALAIQVPERFGRELVGLLADEGKVGHHMREDFLASIIWREPKACTEETVEWLNRLARQERSVIWNTVLHVATEPSHPFNADRLHRNLFAMEMPRRDASWSIYLARNYHEAEDGEPESVARTLVRWAWEGNKVGADDETIRLCAVALVWCFTTSNRVLRDQATKAVVSLLSERPHLIDRLLESFDGVNDPYVAERLYCSVYGAVLQNVSDTALSTVAAAVYQHVFAQGAPPPHVLLRDYALGVIEYASHRGCLPAQVDLAKARPPYRSDPWPLEIPTEAEAEDQTTRDSIRASVLHGDFGRYVMGDSSEWSVTPLSEPRPLTHRDRLEAFSRRLEADPNSALADAFRDLNEAATPKPGLDGVSLAERAFRAFLGHEPPERGTGSSVKEVRESQIAEAEQNFLALLPEEERLYFEQEIKPYLEWEWGGHLIDRSISFNIQAERRWVWRRALSLGWTEDLFCEFERTLYGGREDRKVERIGKKYQWVAWHELQARMSDHLYFIGEDGDRWDGARYHGPWQLGARDIDPSLLLGAGDRDVRASYPERVWWRPASVEYSPGETTEERVARLWSAAGFPDIEPLLAVRDAQGGDWLVLEGMSVWNDREDEHNPRPYWDTWMRIQSFIVSKSDVPKVIAAFRGKSLTDGFELQNPLGWKAFAGEYPWHPIVASMSEEWRVPDESWSQFRLIPVPYLIPTVKYSWESGRDQSLQRTIEVHLPSGFLRDRLGLRWEDGRTMRFRTGQGALTLFDPTTTLDGPPATLVARAPVVEMLDSEGLALMWRIAGEKGLYGRGFNGDFYGRQVLSAVFYPDGAEIRGEAWRLETRPHV